VIPEIIPSTVGYVNKSKVAKAMIYFTPFIKGVLVGLILSDAWVGFSSQRSKNARLQLEQSTKNSQYFWYVFNILSGGSPYKIRGISLL
jgi:LAGLIDADG DNA endonuclease family